MNPAERSSAHRDEALSGLYRDVAAGEPPADLDKAILSAALAEGRPAPRRAAARRSWLAPAGLAMAAVLAVAIGLVIDTETRVAPPPEPAAGGRSAPNAPGETPPVRRDTPNPAARQAPASQERSAPRPTAPAQDIAPPAAGARASKDEAEVADSPEPDRRAAPPRAAGKTAAATEDDARETTSLRKASPAASSAAPAAAVVAPPGSAAPAAAGAAPRPAPEQWIEKVRQLRAEGRESEARQALSQFREAYPDHPLPEDLR